MDGAQVQNIEKKINAFKVFKYRKIFETFMKIQESSPYQSFKVSMLNKKFLKCVTKYY